MHSLIITKGWRLEGHHVGRVLTCIHLLCICLYLVCKQTKIPVHHALAPWRPVASLGSGICTRRSGFSSGSVARYWSCTFDHRLKNLWVVMWEQREVAVLPNPHNCHVKLKWRWRWRKFKSWGFLCAGNLYKRTVLSFDWPGSFRNAKCNKNVCQEQWVSDPDLCLISLHV